MLLLIVTGILWFAFLDTSRVHRVKGYFMKIITIVKSLAIVNCDADYVGSPSNRRSTSRYCVFVGDNLISSRNKKQHVVAKSSAEAEHCAMAIATYELIAS